MNKVILIEFNELSPMLLKQWMASGDLPNFKKLHDTSVVYTTLSDELAPANMEPWIQWYSLHTGLPYSEHKVFHLTDGPRAGHLDIWQHLHNHGKKVWNCSSMNARGFKYADSAYLADPWCANQTAYPPELNEFQNFVSRQVKEYSAAKRISVMEAVRFIRFMMKHGLSYSTVNTILAQLMGEARSKGRTTWQRVAVLDRLMLDIFLYFYRLKSPDFSTFFLNSTAHLQHSYWRHMEPEKFAVKPTASELEQFKNSIKFGYKNMDDMLGRIRGAIDSSTRLVFATALSQQPFLKYENVGGQHFYRPYQVEHLLDTLGVIRLAVEPVMTHQFLLRFSSAEDVQRARKILKSLMLDGRQLFGFSEADESSLYFGCQVQSQVDLEQEVGSSIPGLDGFKFGAYFYKIDAMKSGCHHPEGCLWIESENAKVVEQKVSILDVFPTISDMLKVPSPQVSGRALAY